MLSMVVFGLGVMTLVARHEVALTGPASALTARIADASQAAHSPAAALSSASSLPGGSVAR
jgi:hypothetical protein